MKNPGDGRRLHLPVLRVAFQFGAPMDRQRIPLCATVVLGDVPLAFDQAVPLEATQPRKQRSAVDLKYAFTDLFDADPDAVAVHRLRGGAFEAQTVGRP